MTEKLKELCSVSKKLNVLYVEDELHLLEVTQAMLNNIFEKVVVANNGEEGFARHEEYFLENGKHFDIVITDIKMPKVNGIDLCKKIKKINKKQIIIVTSAHDDSSNLIQFINCGIKKFIKKPFTLQNIVNTFTEIIGEMDVKKFMETIEFTENYIWKIDDKRLFQFDNEIKLTQNEICILDILIKNKGQIFSNSDFYYILEKDNFDKDLSINSIKAILKRMRKKLPLNLIENIYGQGYRLNLKKVDNKTL